MEEGSHETLTRSHRRCKDAPRSGETHLKQEMENIMKNTKKGGGGSSSSSSSVKGRSEQCWRISLHRISGGDAGQRLL